MSAPIETVYLKPVLEGIPETLKEKSHFVLWRSETREGKATKVPYQANGRHAKSNDPATWTSFPEASKALNNGGNFDGIGFVLSPQDNFTGIDLDKCRDPQTGAIEPWAQNIIKGINSYTEVSPSGTGIRIFVKDAQLPEHGRKRGKIEIYESGRYLTLTGHRVEGTPETIEGRQDQVIRFHKAVFDQKPKEAQEKPVPPAVLNQSDEALLARIYQAKNGEKIRSLFNGTFSGYPSQSEADLALCMHFAFWTDKDGATMDRLFRRSGLFREKWDKKHYSGGKTYGEETIRRACENTSETYKGGRQEEGPGKTESAKEDLPDLKVIDASSYLSRDPTEPEQIIEGTFDVGDKLAVIGSSKLRKSFFVQQMMLSIAAGIDLLSWRIPEPRRVLYCQFEIKDHHQHRRIKRMARAMGITADHLEDRLQIINGRGLGISGPEGLEKIQKEALRLHPAVIVFDPLYKLSTGVENAAEDTKVILNAFDVLAEQTGAAIVYVHHDSKGSPGDRDIRDRGAGSNVLGRDYDACITLTAHAQDPDAAIIDVLLRNYPPQEAFTIMWTQEENDGYCFEVRYDLLPEKKTSKTKPQQPAMTVYLPIAEAILGTEEMDVSDFKEEFKRRTSLSDHRIKEFLRWTSSGDDPYIIGRQIRGLGLNRKWVKVGRHYEDGK